MNYTTAKRIVSFCDFILEYLPIILLLGIPTLLLPIGIGLYASGTNETVGKAFMILGSVTTTTLLLLIGCRWFHSLYSRAKIIVENAPADTDGPLLLSNIV